MGVVDYIQKPSPDFDVIAERVQSAVRLHRGREPGDAPRSAVRAVEAPRNQVLVRGADEIVATLRALQSKMKPGSRAALNRALSEAEAHAALVRGR
jgi:hypothetical protein